jgi:hypothetical protein
MKQETDFLGRKFKIRTLLEISDRIQVIEAVRTRYFKKVWEPWIKKARRVGGEFYAGYGPETRLYRVDDGVSSSCGPFSMSETLRMGPKSKLLLRMSSTDEKEQLVKKILEANSTAE